jgi:hypothetical protein
MISKNKSEDDECNYTLRCSQQFLVSDPPKSVICVLERF